MENAVEKTIKYFLLAIISFSLLASAQYEIVGRPCHESTECFLGSFCTSHKHCACLSTYVAIGGYCWRRECTVVWGTVSSRYERRRVRLRPQRPMRRRLARIVLRRGRVQVRQRSRRISDRRRTNLRQLWHVSNGRR